MTTDTHTVLPSNPHPLFWIRQGPQAPSGRTLPCQRYHTACCSHALVPLIRDSAQTSLKDNYSTTLSENASREAAGQRSARRVSLVTHEHISPLARTGCHRALTARASAAAQAQLERRRTRSLGKILGEDLP